MNKNIQDTQNEPNTFKTQKQTNLIIYYANERRNSNQKEHVSKHDWQGHSKRSNVYTTKWHSDGCLNFWKRLFLLGWVCTGLHLCAGHLKWCRYPQCTFFSGFDIFIIKWMENHSLWATETFQVQKKKATITVIWSSRWQSTDLLIVNSGIYIKMLKSLQLCIY